MHSSPKQVELVLSLLPVRKNGLYHTHVQVFCEDHVRDGETLFAGSRRELEKLNKTVDKSIGTQISQVNRRAFQVTDKQ